MRTAVCVLRLYFSNAYQVLPKGTLLRVRDRVLLVRMSTSGMFHVRKFKYRFDIYIDPRTFFIFPDRLSLPPLSDSAFCHRTGFVGNRSKYIILTVPPVRWRGQFSTQTHHDLPAGCATRTSPSPAVAAEAAVNPSRAYPNPSTYQ